MKEYKYIMNKVKASDTLKQQTVQMLASAAAGQMPSAFKENSQIKGSRNILKSKLLWIVTAIIIAAVCAIAIPIVLLNQEAPPPPPAPAPVSVIQPVYEGGTLYVGDGLPPITTTTTGGTVALDAGQTLAEGTHNYTWTFTPTDGRTYTNTKGIISLTAVLRPPVPVAVVQPVYEGGTLYAGDDLPPITTTTTGGTVALDVGQTLAEGTHNYTWTFTPTDGRTYTNTTGIISLTAVLRPPAPVSVVQPVYEGGTLYVGDGLPPITTVTTGGTVALDVGQTLAEGTHNYTWTFTPTDGRTYTNTTGTILLTVIAAWDGERSDGLDGAGTKQQPFAVRDGGDLAFLAEKINTGTIGYNGPDVYYKMADDIYLNDIRSFNSWGELPPENEWTPIGTAANTFRANFDGNGFSVFGIFILTGADNQGFFGVVGGETKGGSILNLTIAFSYIEGGDGVGGVAGAVFAHETATVMIEDEKWNGEWHDELGWWGTGTTKPLSEDPWIRIENVKNDAVVKGEYFVGGIAGKLKANEYVQIIGCINTGEVSGINVVGGIAGYVRAGGAVEIINSCNTGSVTSESNKLLFIVEGYNRQIVGDLDAGEFIVESYTETALSLTFLAIGRMNTIWGGTGGIVGTLASGLQATVYGWIDVNNCYNTGRVTCGGYNAGGIVGFNVLLGGCDPILNSYNTGDISGIAYIGGIVGVAYADGHFRKGSDYLLNNFNTGRVSGENVVGGIAGYAGETYTLVNCYNSGTVLSSGTGLSGVNVKGGIAGIGFHLQNCYYKDTETNALGPQPAALIDYWAVHNNGTITQDDCSRFDEAGMLEAPVGGKTTLLDALSDWVENEAIALGTVEFTSGGNYLSWTENMPAVFVPDEAIPSDCDE